MAQNDSTTICFKHLSFKLIHITSPSLMLYTRMIWAFGYLNCSLKTLLTHNCVQSNKLLGLSQTCDFSNPFPWLTNDILCQPVQTEISISNGNY